MLISKTKKCISMLFLVIMVCGVVFTGTPLTVLAEETDAVIMQAIDDITASLEGGYGSNGKFLAPFLSPVAGSIPISTRAELEAIRDNLSGNYHLTQDIDLSGAEWVPIGNRSLFIAFSGVFDGQGHVIHNLTITGDYEYAGLFGYTDGATIKNVGLEDTLINIVSSAYPVEIGAICVGSICGCAQSEASSFISNCYNIGDVSVAAVSASTTAAASYAGGICGMFHNSFGASISNCYNMGTVSASAITTNTTVISPPPSSGVSAGGICANSTNLSVINSYNTGDVSASASSYFRSNAVAGGILGSGSGGNIINSYNTGGVSASAIADSPDSSYFMYTFAGGICANDHSVSVKNSYNMGDVSATTFSASSTSNDSIISYVGGICGSSTLSDSTCIINSYNTGAASASASSSSLSSRSDAYAGGIGGNFYSTLQPWYISNSYNTGALSAGISSPAADSLSLVGGICGYLPLYDYSHININNCYWQQEIDQIVDGIPLDEVEKRGLGNTADTGTAPLTIAQMKNQGSFTGFDFTDVWDISASANDGYPFIRVNPAFYTVVFEDWDGTPMRTEIINHGLAATAPTVPFRFGYVFKGWDIDGFDNVTSDMTITALYISEQDVMDDYGVKVEIDITADVIADFNNDIDKISVAGAAFNVMPGETITVHFSKPVTDVVVDLPFVQKDNAVQFDIKLTGATDLIQDPNSLLHILFYPIAITLPIPAGISPQNFLILHFFGSGNTYLDVIEPTINGDGTCTFIVDSLSVFVFANINSTVRPTLQPGDVNGDNFVNMQDVLLIYQSFRGKVMFSENQQSAADVNGDSVVNMQDVLMVYQYFRGKITKFQPVA